MNLKVPPLDLKAEFREVHSEVNKRVKSVFESGRYILGPQVEEFEASFRKFIGSKYALGVASGSDAILLPLMAYNIKPGDEVITTPFTFIATATAIVRLGAKPVFADIDPVTFNIDPKEIKKKITRKTRGIIAVHLYGNPCQMDEITRLAKKHKLFVIEDCAQSCGSMFKGKKVGTFGHVGAFSFYPTKTLGASGDAGAITTNDKKLYEKLKSLRHHGDNGSHHSYQHPHIGINSRLDEIQAAVLNSKLKHLPKWNKKRRKIAMAYIQSLKSHGLSNVILPSETPGGKSVFHQFTLRVLKGKRNGLMNYLRTNRIFSSIFYPIPLHLQPCFRRFGYKKGNFKQAEQASQEVVSLPIYPQLLNKAQRNIVSCISSYLS